MVENLFHIIDRLIVRNCKDIVNPVLNQLTLPTSAMKEVFSARISKRCKERYFLQSLEATRAFQAQNLAGCGISQLHKPYEISRKYPEAHAILFTLAGKGRLDLPGPRQELKPGSVCLLPAGQNHAYGSDSIWSVLWFHPQDTGSWTELMPATATVITSVWAKKLRILSEAFLQEAARRDRVHHSRILEGYTHLIALFLRRELHFSERSADSAHRRRLEDLWQLVLENPCRTWNIKTLAQTCGFSRSHLHAVVRRIYGYSAMEMVGRLRMERAAGLILDRHAKLAEVAERVGYKSPFSFSNAFKRIMGVAPQDYRR